MADNPAQRILSLLKESAPLTEGIQDAERDRFTKRTMARIAAGLAGARKALASVEAEAKKYEASLKTTWTYSGDATRLAEDLEAFIERFEYLK